MFIERNESGDIVAVYASAQPGAAEEYLPAEDQQIFEFYERLKEVPASE